MNKDKWLFAIDLDGTLLKDSRTGEIHEEDLKAIKKIISEGHVVCIVTGRPWKSTEKTYKKLNLNTVVGNYNGAQIHNPKDYNFIPNISYMNLNDVMFILGDEKVKAAMSNLAIEGPGWVMVEKKDNALENIFGFKDAAKYKIGIDYTKLPLKPTGIILDTKKGVNILELKDYLTRTYGDLAEFSSWSKGDGLTPVFDITNVGVTKGKVLSLMSRYYDIPLERTVSIGDGYNDIPMFETSEISVSLRNSSKDIKKRTTYSTSKTNKEGGIAEFINKFLEDKDGSFIKKLKDKRKDLHDIKIQTTKAH